MRPYIARVCGFARGAAECKKTQTSAKYGRVLHEYVSNIGFVASVAP